MYTDFYGFTETPFNITPDPRFLFLTEGHAEALASAFYGIREKRGLVCITGEVGTGKTTVIYRLIDRLPDRVRRAFIYHTSITFGQLLKNMLLELRVPVESEEKDVLVRQLNTYLIDRLRQDEIVTVFIDEAESLPVEALEGLRILSNLETRTEKLLQIVLVGLPELDTKLDSDEMRPLRQRIVIRRRIRPLSQEESREYIDHRLRIVGGSSSKVFTPEAVLLICSQAEGIPRLINVICDNALVAGYGAGQKKVGDELIRQVISQVNGPDAGNSALIFPSVPPAQQEPENHNVHNTALLKKWRAAVTGRRTQRPLR